MKYLLVSIFLFCSLTIFAQPKINMSFNNEDLNKVIETYSKASGQKFVVDPSVRGKISIFLPEPVTIEEAFNHLSTALAVNGYAISKQLDTMVVRTARNIQRDLIEVSTERPALKPERMYTWIYKGKHLSAEQISRELRILSSRDGEISPYTRTNQIIICDWVSNINRVADLLNELDKPVDANTMKVVESYKKDRVAFEKEMRAFREKEGREEKTFKEDKVAKEEKTIKEEKATKDDKAPKESH
jgi:general secretion pathway protein D